MFKVKSVTKFLEEDTYENGCLPDTSNWCYVEARITEPTLDKVLEKIYSEFNCKKEDIDFTNPMEEDGRIDISVMEDEQGCRATDFEIEKWKEGKMRLFLADYIVKIVEFTEKPADFSEYV